MFRHNMNVKLQSVLNLTDTEKMQLFLFKTTDLFWPAGSLAIIYIKTVRDKRWKQYKAKFLRIVSDFETLVTKSSTIINPAKSFSLKFRCILCSICKE